MTEASEQVQSGQQMRICQVLASWDYGGLEKHVIELCNELAQRHEVHVIVHPALADKFAEGVKVHLLDFSRSRWSPLLLLGLFWHLRRINPDVIHAQANKATSLVSVLKRFLTGCFIATIHNQKKSRRMFSSMDHVIAVSPGVGRQISGVPVTNVFNGIAPLPTLTLRRSDLANMFGFDSKRPILISVGRLVEAKGYDILIPAAAKAGAQVLIVGSGELEQRLRAQVREVGAEVVLAGFRSDVLQLMGAADGFVLSSRREGFAYVVVEALLIELPMIATDIPMMEGVLPQNLMVPSDNVTALANMIEAKLNNLDTWRHEMADAFAFAKNNLTLSGMVMNTEAVYLKALYSKSHDDNQ